MGATAVRAEMAVLRWRCESQMSIPTDQVVHFWLGLWLRPKD